MRAESLITAVALVVSSAGCGDPRLRSVHEDVQVSPEALEFGDVFLGGRGELELTLTAGAGATTTATLEVSGPFDVESSFIRLERGAQRTIRVGFAPLAPGAVSSMLRLTTDGRERRIPLTGTGLEPLSCVPSSSCVQATFDPNLGACVEAPVREGESCSSACLVGDATCMAGRCVGTSRQCDDGDPCTIDACAPASGCTFVPRVCPSPADNPCQVGACVPGSGCAVEALPDDTPCGGGRICGAGQCVWKRPDPKILCAQPTPCQGPGTWSNGVCERPAPSLLVPAWHWQANEAGLPVPDENGNLYWVEMDRTARTQDLVSVTPGGALRFRAPLGSPRGGFAPLVRAGRVFVLEYDSAGDYVAARSTLTGAVQWRRNIAAELGLGDRAMHMSLVLAPGDTLRLIAASNPNAPPQSLVTLDANDGSIQQSTELDAQVELWAVDPQGRSLLTTWASPYGGAHKEVRDASGALLWSAYDPDWPPDPFGYGVSITEDGRVQDSASGAVLAQLALDGAETTRMERNPRFLIPGGAVALGRELPPGATWTRWVYRPTHIFIQPLPTGAAQVFAPDDGKEFLATSPMHLTAGGALLYADDDLAGGFRLRAVHLTGEVLYECPLPWIPTTSCCGSHFFGDSDLLLDGRWVVSAGQGGVYAFDLPGVAPDPTAIP